MDGDCRAGAVRQIVQDVEGGGDGVLVGSAAAGVGDGDYRWDEGGEGVDLGLVG